MTENFSDFAKQLVSHFYCNIYRVGQKSKPAYFCNNFVYCKPIFIFFGTYIYIL